MNDTVQPSQLNQVNQPTPEQSMKSSQHPSETPTTSSSTSPSSTPPKKKPLSIPTIIAVLIVILVAGLFVLNLMFQKELKKTEPIIQTTRPVTPAAKLVIGTDATFAPMESIDKTGNLVGYDIDLGYKIANALGVKTEFQNIKFDDLFPALTSKKIDIIISAVTITDERKKQFDFSDQYLNAGQVIITAKTNTLIKIPADLSGKKIGVQKGTTNETEAQKYTAANLVIRYDDFGEAAKALVAGKLDAIVSDLPGAKGIVDANPTLKIASDPFTNDYYGIVLRKDEPDLKNKINKILATLQQTGALTNIRQKWFE